MAALPDRARPARQPARSFEVVLPGQLPETGDVLARAQSENFTVAARVLPYRIRQHLMAVYGFARLVDYAGDEACGPREGLLDLLDSDLGRVYEGSPRLPLLRAFAPTVHECGIPREVPARLITANRRDQYVRRYETFEELLDYCKYAANPVGELVLYIFGRADPELTELSDRICSALQILEHSQDVAEDYQQDRIYLPTEDLHEFGCRESELATSAASSELRGLVWFEVDRAVGMLRAGQPLVARLSGLARLAVAGYVAGGLATARAFRPAGHDPLAVRIRPGRLRMLGEWARLSLAPESRGEHDRTASAYEYCEQITRTQARNFSYGIRLLPAGKRKALSAVYAFARRVDDIGDGTLSTERKLERLEHTRTKLREVHRDSKDPMLVALADAARELPIPLEAFHELVDGCEADVRGNEYETFEQLAHYCRCVAGSIGRLSLGVFGQPVTGVAAERADALGVALQLTNILRDLLEDRRRGRIYLPQEDLRRFGVTLELDSRGMFTDDASKVAELVRFQSQRAERWYGEGLRLLPMLDHRSRACCAAMAGIYHELLRRITADPTLVMRGRTGLSGWQKAVVAARSFAGMSS
ncbi:farnesyl-diphosphate farnesyltransferase [Actinopolyspora saharensis]|uniref:Farnesyl-diphosphate farnesyltransferase n=2 Tax=Actinopolyspora saharensis TaxID=995062 RepID=A0A1H0ZY09_9ACTN|nr:squalene synthase HpnC [Actinopolyspora saharensis]SDQ32335.1 farnesyl-diphosphate farnesyltransferase [Actinopolyspora saharensis]